MNSGSPFTDLIFNRLSSIYRKDNGMTNSDLFTVINAQGEQLTDVQRKIDQVSNNAYINTADSDALEANFGILVDFPKPPRLNTLTNGDEIYRSMLRSLFHVFQSGSTSASMNQAIDIAISYLTVDTRTSDFVAVTNYSNLLPVTSEIQLTWNAVATSGTTITGPATTGIVFFPNDLIVTNYDDASRTIQFTGTINTGTTYQILYNRDNRLHSNSNWINLTNTSEIRNSPFNLLSGNTTTYNNPTFSYWWNTYNADGQGVVIDEFQITPSDSSLVWRLPEKTIQFKSPYTGQFVEKTIEFYNLSGTSYDIEHVDAVNQDTIFGDEPTNYYDEVSSDYRKYHIRYSANNSGPVQSLSQFKGSFSKFTKKYKSINFDSSNFGLLDFFESGTNFDTNDLFGTGTKHVWLDVPNVNGQYVLSNDFVFTRPFSLHESILFEENFESGDLSRMQTTNTTGMTITDLVGVPSYQKEDCLMLSSHVTGIAISASPILNSGIINRANHISVDIFDSLNTGTQSFVDITRTGISNQYSKFRFGIDSDSTGFIYSSQDPLSVSQSFGFVETYFESLTSTDRSVFVSGVSNGNIHSYTLVTGTNPNTEFSNTSMLVTGTNANIYVNAPSELVNNTNKLSLQFNLQNNISISITNLKNLGISNVSNQTFFHPETFLLNANPSTSSFWNWNSSTVSSYDPNTDVVVMSPFGGVSTIPASTGLHVIEIIKGSGTFLDGVKYTGPFTDPGVMWDDLGTKNGTNPSFGDPRSVLVVADPGEIFYHYELSNIERKQQFLDNLNAMSDTGEFPVPYFYQLFTSENSNPPKSYLSQFPREFGWKTITADFGVGFSGNMISMNGVNFLNLDIPFSGNLASVSGISLKSNSENPQGEFSYFDNINISYYDPSMVLPEYDLSMDLENDWEGSALSQSTIIDNKYFEMDFQPNFQFNVLVKGLDPSFIFIVNQLIERLKPAHTIATSIFEQDQSLDTTELEPITASTGTNWETGNIMNNIIIKATGQGVIPTIDNPGYITISGSQP